MKPPKNFAWIYRDQIISMIDRISSREMAGEIQDPTNGTIYDVNLSRYSSRNGPNDTHWEFSITIAYYRDSYYRTLGTEENFKADTLIKPVQLFLQACDALSLDYSALQHGDCRASECDLADVSLYDDTYILYRRRHPALEIQRDELDRHLYDTAY